MKTISQLLIYILLAVSTYCKSQEIIDISGITKRIEFEDTSEYKYILIDTNKTWFISHSSNKNMTIPSQGEFVILTDTNQYYGIGLFSSFQFQLVFNAMDFYYISFFQSYDFELNRDGGIIETSYDNGTSWQNIIYDHKIMDNLGNIYQFYSEKDTIYSFQNQPGFTGVLNSDFPCSIEWANPDMYYDTMLLRFTFASDSFESNNEGWMLDRFAFGGGLVPINQIKATPYSFVYPNPVEKILHIKAPENRILNQIKIFNTAGVLMIDFAGVETQDIDLSNLKTGIYYILIMDDKGNFYTDKVQKL